MTVNEIVYKTLKSFFILFYKQKKPVETDF